MLKRDPVYRAALQHLQSLADREQTAEFGISGAGVPDSVQEYEDQIRQVGDIMFRNRPFVSTTNWIWTMKWEHVGMYADDSEVYDSDTGQNPCSGVALRRIETFIRQGAEIQLAQLRSSRGRQYEQRALANMQTEYGTQCQTGYNKEFWVKNRVDAMYCSQLVWETYRNIPYDFDVDVDSNHWRYRLWVWASYGPAAATGIVSLAVAPDEIALDGDIHNYYRTTIHIATTQE